MVKKCAFCRRNADSREHIFSDWMLEMLPPGERYQFTERVVKRNEFVRYHGRKVQIKAKVVCWQCNNGWMSALEGCLKKAIGHILFDDTRIAILTPTETATIAAFGFKTLVIANHKDLTAPPFFTSAQRFLFRRELRIPDGVQIWMATRKGIAGKYYGFWKSVHGETDKGVQFGFANYICTWNFQNIVIQVMATKWQNKTRRKTTPPISFPQDNYWEQASVLIWPPNGKNLQWPPPFYLGSNTLEEFRDRWDTIKVTFS